MTTVLAGNAKQKMVSHTMHLTWGKMLLDGYVRADTVAAMAWSVLMNTVDKSIFTGL